MLQIVDPLCISSPSLVQCCLVYINKTDVLTENSWQVLEKQDSWRVEIAFVQAADIVGGKKRQTLVH